MTEKESYSKYHNAVYNEGKDIRKECVMYGKLIVTRNAHRKNLIYFFGFVFGAITPSGTGPPHSRGFYITYNDTAESAELLWTSDQTVAETCI
jgi:hypothetical protein